MGEKQNAVYALMPLALVFELAGIYIILSALNIIPGFNGNFNVSHGVIALMGLVLLAAGGLMNLGDPRLQVFHAALWFQALKLGLEIAMLASLGFIFGWIGFFEGSPEFIFPALVTGFITLYHAVRGVRRVARSATDAE